MIISKDLFLLGEQDYLRLPKDEKRARKSTQLPPADMNKIPADESRVEHTALTFPCMLEPSRPLQLVFQDICVTVQKRQILKDVSGVVRPGQVLAVMGPSGCGKTTLLDCLSGQRPINSGSVRLNRERLSKKWRRRICYVLQQDIFFAGLTLRETLEYTAMLRLPEKLPRSEKMRCVDHILEVLDLTPCQHTKIGDYLNRGLSGGEKKRANIACELLTNPSIILLDEPTSGLDSHAATSLIFSLQKLAAHEHKTIVITVHQPSSQMFHMFDRLLLLCQGQTAYFGDVTKVVDSFQDIGLTMKPHYNPADFILEQIKSSPEVRKKIIASAKAARKSPSYPSELNNDVYSKEQGLVIEDFRHLHGLIKDDHVLANGVTVDETQSETEGKHLWMDTQSHSSSASSDSQDNDFWLGYPTNFYTQFKVLSQRNFKEAKPRMLSRLNWFQTIGLGVMAGALWFQLPKNEESLHDIQGWMFFSQTYWMLFALFGALSSFPPEREVISKERRSGAYRLSAYYIAKMVGELPLVITLPAVYHLISYPMLGFSSPSLFFTMLAFLLLNTVVAQSVGFFVGACCMDMNLSITVSALYTLATQLFGGYLSTRFPAWLEWVRYTSMIHYAYQNMQILEFSEGPPILCANQSKFPICTEFTDGIQLQYIPVESILEAQGCTSPLWLNTLVLLCFLVVFRLLGYIVLRFVRCPK